MSKQSVRYESNSISHEPFGSLSTVGPSTHGREIASGKKAPEVDVSGIHGPNGDADLAMRRTREHEAFVYNALRYGHSSGAAYGWPHKLDSAL